MATRRCTVFPPMQAPWLIVTMFNKVSGYAVTPCNHFCLLKDSIQPDSTFYHSFVFTNFTKDVCFRGLKPTKYNRTHLYTYIYIYGAPYVNNLLSFLAHTRGGKSIMPSMAQNRQNLRAQIANFEIWWKPIEQSGCPGGRFGSCQRPTFFVYNFMIPVRGRYI